MAFGDRAGNPLRALKAWMDRSINYRIAWAAALVLGAVVFAVNLPHGAGIATTSALKQGAYTFFVAGFITRYNEVLALRLRDPRASLVLATVVCSCLTVGLTFFLHSLRGTAEPFLSTLPTLVMALPGFGVLAWRRQAEERRALKTDQLRKS